MVSDIYKDISVFALIGDETACTYYRVINPLTMLQHFGAKVGFAKGLNFEAIAEHNIIWISRQSSEYLYDWLNRFGFQNKLIIYDIDDDFDHVQPSNPAYKFYHPGSDTIKMSNETMKLSGGIFTTVDPLKKWYSRLNNNIHTIPNYIDFSLRDWSTEVRWDGVNPIFKLLDIERPTKWDGKCVLGYSGSASHVEDFGIVAPTIKKWLENPNAHFVFNSNVEFFNLVMNHFKFPESKCEHIPPTDFENHPKLLKGVDIWLAPILCNDFNLAKSSLKLIESMAAGGTVVASCVGEYAKLHNKHKDSFILVGNNKYCSSDWLTPLNYLYNNPTQLNCLQKKGREAMVRHESLEQNVHSYVASIQSVIQNIRKGNCWVESDIKDKRTYKTIGRNDPCPILANTKYKKGYYGAFG